MEMSKNNPLGRNIYFGVREHAMGAILNGMALSGFSVYGSTFLAFADYLKPALRLTCQMNLPVTYIFTHDSVNIGEDGPTHQPIEQLASLRCTPNLDVYRPADVNEVIGCWDSILKRRKPAALIISKKDVEVIPSSKGIETLKGAYIIKQETTPLKAIIIATGTEVTTALKIASELDQGIRVVSMPSVNIFTEQDSTYQEAILPKNVKKISLEAGSTSMWYRYVDYPIGIDRYGLSGKEQDVLAALNFDYEHIKKQIETIINN